jgi:methionyl-tRNA formyltransferase
VVIFMRVLFIGQQAFGSDALAALVEQGEEVVGVITGRGKGEVPDPVAVKAGEVGLPVLQTGSLKNPEVAGWIAERKPDLMCLAFVTWIVPQTLIDLAPLGGINYHPSLLPRHRGGSAMNWAILQGDRETGVTIHYIDAGIDTGDIILQERVPIEPGDSVKTLYFQKLYPLGIKLIARAVALIREGKAPRIPQDESQATYEPLITEEHLHLDWNQPAQELHRVVRAGDPAPGAVTRLRGEKLKIWAGRPVEGLSSAAHKPGTIVAVNPEGFLVQAGRGCLQVERVQFPGTKKIMAPELVTRLQLQPGEVLG